MCPTWSRIRSWVPCSKPRESRSDRPTQVTFVWSLGPRDGDASVADRREASTSVHLAQWRAEERARDEVLVRVRGEPRVKLNRVFEVSCVRVPW